MKEVSFKKGDVVFREGEEGKYFYYIKSGKVGIYAAYGQDEGECLTSLDAGAYFGEMAVIEAYPRSATAVALEDVEVTELSTEEINEYFHSEPDKIIAIMKHLTNRLSELTNDFAGATATLEEMKGTKAEARSEKLLARIKKYVSEYRRNKIYADRESVESVKVADEKSHSEGYTGEVNNYKEGTILFKEGEIGKCMYDIHGGEVGIFKGYKTPDEKLLTKLMTNEFFGEIGLLGSVERTATAVVTANNTIVESIYLSDLEELFKQNPFKVDMLLRHTSNRLRQLTREYLAVCRKISEAGTEA